MGEEVLKEVFSLSDSVFLVLLVGLALGTWWIIRYSFKKNDDREQRYISVIETQSKALQSLEILRADVKEIKYELKRR